MRLARFDPRKKGNPHNTIYDQRQTYTEREHREWLKEAGFADFERKILPDGFSMVRARKAR